MRDVLRYFVRKSTPGKCTYVIHTWYVVVNSDMAWAKVAYPPRQQPDGLGFEDGPGDTGHAGALQKKLHSYKHFRFEPPALTHTNVKASFFRL